MLCSNLITVSGTSNLFRIVQSASLGTESYAFLISIKATICFYFVLRQYSIIVFKLKIYNAQDLPCLNPY